MTDFPFFPVLGAIFFHLLIFFLVVYHIFRNRGCCSCSTLESTETDEDTREALGTENIELGDLAQTANIQNWEVGRSVDILFSGRINFNLDGFDRNVDMGDPGINHVSRFLGQRVNNDRPYNDGSPCVSQPRGHLTNWNSGAELRYSDRNENNNYTTNDRIDPGMCHISRFLGRESSGSRNTDQPDYISTNMWSNWIESGAAGIRLTENDTGVDGAIAQNNTDPGLNHISRFLGRDPSDQINIYNSDTDIGVGHIRRALGMSREQAETERRSSLETEQIDEADDALPTYEEAVQMLANRSLEDVPPPTYEDVIMMS